MNVLSLFDGISCGMAALERAEIPIENYSAYEIDKYAVAVSQKNYPEINQCGDVLEGNFKKHKGCDLLIGGSPCTYWSAARKNREITPDGEGFRLFMQYVRALEGSKPKYFLYENNFSIHKNIKSEISSFLGVEPIMINSALVSAQHRKRCYWTNIPNVTQPDDKNIQLKDVIEHCQNAQTSEPIPINTFNNIGIKSRTLMAGYYKYGEATILKNKGFKGGTTSVAIPINGNVNNKYAYGKRIYTVYEKTAAISHDNTKLFNIDLPNGKYIIRKLTPVEAERLQTLPDNYTEGISDTQRYKCIGNGWTVDVISHILGFIPK